MHLPDGMGGSCSWQMITARRDKADVIEDARNGRLVPPATPPPPFTALRRLLDNATLWNDLCPHSSDMVRRKYQLRVSRLIWNTLGARAVWFRSLEGSILCCTLCEHPAPN